MSSTSSSAVLRKRPNDLDLSNTNIKNVGGTPRSALAMVRNIDDIRTVQYPEGVMSPKPKLNANVKDGRFRYDRGFLLQFMGVCTQKPDLHPFLEPIIGLESLDQAPLGTTRGGSGRHRQGSGAAAPSQKASVGLGFGPSSSLGKSSSKLTSEERFANSTSRLVPVKATTGLPYNMQQTANQDGAGGAPPKKRTRTKRGGNEVNKVQQGDGSGFNNFQANAQNAKIKPVALESIAPEPVAPKSVAPLQMSANRWDRKAIQIDPDSPEMVHRKVKALLNKLTTEKFDSISGQVIAWANKSEKEKDGRTLIQVIRLVFEHAIDGATWSELYAHLCREMMNRISPKVQDEGVKNSEGHPIAGDQLFRKYLCNRCQEGFERGWAAKEVTAVAAAVKASGDGAANAANQQNKDGRAEEIALFSDEYYAAQKIKRHDLGLIKFVGELFKLQMLTERIMHNYFKTLLVNVEHPEEIEIERSCKLLTTVGAHLDTQKARVHMDVYFSRIKELTKGQNVSLRMQFMLQDIIELREQNWVSRSAILAQKRGSDGRDVAGSGSESSA